MGKGEIISGGTDGFYRLKILMNRLRAENTIIFFNTEIIRLNDIVIPQLETEQSNAETALNAALAALETAITAYNAGEITRNDLIAATRTKTEAENTYQLAIFALKENQLKKDTYTKQIEYLESQTGEDPTIDAWCIDLTENLSGIVGTIEIPGEWTNPIIIRPGYAGRSAYDFRRDGQLMPIMSMTPAQAIYNAMMLPGWQKWMPTYRVGIITERYIAGNNFVFNVTLDAAQSTAQGLNVNESNELYYVPAEYMETDSLVFEIGDRVIIEFDGQNYLRPKIIGFETNPRKCEAIFWVKVTRDDEEIITDAIEFNASFTILNSSEVEADSIISDFDSNPGSPTYCYWKITGFWGYPVEPIDINGYWLTVTSNDSIITQYPYRYKAADKKQAADRISPGIYQMAIPYWAVEEEDTLIGAFISYQGEHHKQFIIKSSIPYRLRYYIVPQEYPADGQLPEGLWLVPKFTTYDVHHIYHPPPGYPPTESYIYLDDLEYGHTLDIGMPSSIPQPDVLLKIDGIAWEEVTQFVADLPVYDEYVYKDPHLSPETRSFGLEYSNLEIYEEAWCTSDEEFWFYYNTNFTANSGESKSPFHHAIYKIILKLEIEYDY